VANESSGFRIPPFRLRLYDPASNPETLARRSFPVAPFYWFATRTNCIYSSACLSRASIVVFNGSWERTATLVLWMLVYSGVYSLSLSLSLSFCPPHRHPRDPLISGLRGSRNEPSEARWHEEGSVGWAVGGSCSKLRYRDLATLTPLRVKPPLPSYEATRHGNNPRLRTRHRCHKRSIFEDIGVVLCERIEISISNLVSR